MNYDPQHPDIRSDGRRIPTIFAHRDTSGLRFYCRYCDTYHIHGVLPDEPIGASDGHHAAHCFVTDSPYIDGGGYILIETDQPIPEPRHRYKPKWLRGGSGGGQISGFLLAIRRHRGSQR